MTTKHETTRSAFVSFFSLQTQEIQNKHERKEIEKEKNIAVKNKEKKMQHAHGVPRHGGGWWRRKREERRYELSLYSVCGMAIWTIYNANKRATKKNKKRATNTFSFYPVHRYITMYTPLLPLSAPHSCKSIALPPCEINVGEGVVKT